MIISSIKTFVRSLHTAGKRIYEKAIAVKNSIERHIGVISTELCELLDSLAEITRRTP